ncbi:hypothetical protein NUH88_07810 [Nisaea acidiphila]|uniref:Antibiotic biosynthesis monooxygenase n=1 Tax=Nisaea acidiphila TaxID=1862145 RepID=A0A9J7AYT3_9PROT|nr:hypothetical protein [Nisaea acidiphila]UUX51593.1 hypothetical protein NUH88_07810 [Nisaea acidiphila]
MKTRQFLQTLSALALITAATTATAEETAMTTKTASYIEMRAAQGQTEVFADFLTGAAAIVRETEPGTELWFALKADDTLVIFDIFADDAARDAHFSGAVAGALNGKAATLVEGGWDGGVVAGISNANVLSAKPPFDLYSATTATYIRLEAASGRSDELAALLSAAGPVVAETEPETLFWTALRIDGTHFAIFDVFAGEAGRDAHFAGKVAGLLKEKAPELVAGGWEDGVVANVGNFDILAIK